jgi:hypothetical protein
MPSSPAVVESLHDQLDKLYNDCLAIKQDVDQWLEQGHIDGLYRYDQMVTAELKFLSKVIDSRCRMAATPVHPPCLKQNIVV